MPRCSLYVTTGCENVSSALPLHRVVHALLRYDVYCLLSLKLICAVAIVHRASSIEPSRGAVSVWRVWELSCGPCGVSLKETATQHESPF